jgi:LCP family protein required for cell wall assembly
VLLAVVGLVERNETRTDQPGSGPELCAHDPDASAVRRKRLSLHHLAGRLEHEVARRSETAADHHELRIEDVHQGADSGAEVTAHALEDRDRLRLAFAGKPHEPMCVDRGTELGLRELRRGGARDVRLEMSVSRAGALARNAAVLDHHVAELSPAAEELAVDDDTPAATGSERQHHHRLDPSSRARVKLRVCRRVRVVLDPDRQREALRHSPANVEAVERNVHRSLDPPGLLVDARGDPEAERDDRVVQELFDGRVEAGEHGVLRLERSRRLAPLLHGAVARNDTGEDLGSAQVDADDTGFSHESALLVALAAESGLEDPKSHYQNDSRVDGRVGWGVAMALALFALTRAFVSGGYGRDRGRRPRSGPVLMLIGLTSRLGVTWTHSVNNPAGYPTASMAEVEKPYRVYRGGRVKGKVPLDRPERSARRNGKPPTQPKVRRPRRRWSWPKRIVVTLFLLILLFVIWAVAGFLAFRAGVEKSNQRLVKTAPTAKSVLTKDNGSLLGSPTTILMLGTDHMNNDQRVNDFHSDSIMLVRTDPGKHRLAYLSIPRDLRVAIPGYGDAKINAAMQLGGPALAIRTIRNFTGLSLNHVMIIDFHNFRKLIDNIGGIDVNVPERILSNPFDCPYNARRCQTWRGWRFAKGPQHMNGWRAQIYSRIRENQLNPADSDITRGERQQQVIRAVEHKLVSLSTFLKLPFDGSGLMTPLTTDLSAWQLAQIGWDIKRAPASHALHCRLGGGSDTSGTSDIIPSEENRPVIGMFIGATAPQPPPPGSQFLPGCLVGNPAGA